MNVTDYTYLINKPDAINEKYTEALGNVLDEFPFFQSARALRLKGLYNQSSFKYNFALKVTAAHTTDRTVLFDFITSDSFTAIQKGFYDKKILELLDINVVDSEIILHEEKPEIKNTLEKSILTSIKEATETEEDKNTKIAEEKLAIGKPLDFSINEKHSFQEWLQLSRAQPIERQKPTETVPETAPLDNERKKKAQLIDKFIETSPKIPPIKHGVASTVTFDLNAGDNSYLMTETLARVYLEQKKYQKAIQAYEILILKYPEKSSFFADRISDIKILQHNNN
ncbi:tetratricopeptide repeat protein [Flavobacterium lacustre]|uniref:tetratricopeptide repeat protein n=1 Tax=Flavobacterium lacustre TaxID=3016339 RepID=UPI0022B70AF3|nr:tetratricopeptide repeat protein [Flavobacterium lacustre]